MTAIALLLAASCALSAVALMVFRRLAPRLNLWAWPGGHSAHANATITGAGIAPALIFTAAAVIAVPPAWLPWALPLIATGLLLALVGLVDDYRDLNSAIRLAIYLLSAIGVVVWGSPPLPLWASVLAVLAVTWVINLSNFMDGLDGFLATQLLCSCVALALLGHFALPQAEAVVAVAMLLIVVWVPFLAFNWPPAKLFMGDAGSVFIGFALAVLGGLAFDHSEALGAAWLIVMMPFLVDATGTLALRLSAGHPPHIGHRDHAYQRLARRTGSALVLDLGLLALHLVWQFPLACWAVLGNYSPWFAVILAAIPSLILLAYARLAQ